MPFLNHNTTSYDVNYLHIVLLCGFKHSQNLYTDLFMILSLRTHSGTCSVLRPASIVQVQTCMLLNPFCFNFDIIFIDFVFNNS